MRIAVFGSTEFSNYKLIRSYIEMLPRDTEIVTNGTHGPAQIAIMVAMQFRMPFRVIYTNWDETCINPKYSRDLNIVQYSDGVICYWDNVSTNIPKIVKLANQFEKPITVFDNDGKVITDLMSVWF